MRTTKVGRAFGLGAVATLLLLCASPAWAFRPDKTWGHRGVTVNGLQAFQFDDTDPQTGKPSPIGFMDLALDSVALDNEEIGSSFHGFVFQIASLGSAEAE